jgi:tetratricopeptide (TPR) repeat protein
LTTMRPRFLAITLGLALAASAMPALAQQTVPPGPRDETLQPAQPPANVQRPHRADQLRGLDFLFGALKIAPDEESAKLVENRIWAMWLASGSDTANLLMARVKAAIDAKDLDLAIKLLNAIVEIKPDYVEAWNRRATIYYMKKDYGRAMADIRQVLTREPRHFGAMTGLGMILHEFGEDKQALQVLRKALAIHPHLQKIPDLVKSLTEKVEGRDI